MSTRPLVILPAPQLRLTSAPIARVDDGVRKLAEDMLETMYAAPGIGLAAVQVGEMNRLITIDVSHDEDAKEPRVFINPEILWKSEELSVYEEGCLSIPDQYAEVLCRATDLPVIITDRDHVISVSGISKKEYLERRISSELETLMESRTNYTASADEEPIYPISGMSREAAVAYPIIGSGDVSGCVVLLLNSDGSLPSETERKLVAVAASFLGKQMEE